MGNLGNFETVGATVRNLDQWSTREERIIAALMATENLSRIRAIHAMRRRKLDDLEGRTFTLATVQELRARIDLQSGSRGKYARYKTYTASPKGGRPRKYRTDRERRIAERQQNANRQRAHRQRKATERNGKLSASA
jgi:hypothetical protein